MHYLDDQHTPISIFLDLAKAFDPLDHDILLFKLQHYGITGTPYKGFCSYLSNRQQYTQYGTYMCLILGKFDALTEPLFERLNILKISDIFDKQRLKFYHKFYSDMLPVFFNSMYVKHGHIHQHDTRQRDEIHNSVTRLIMTEKCVRHYIPELLCKTQNCITEKKWFP